MIEYFHQHSHVNHILQMQTAVRQRTAMTLMEVLVVIVILSVLAAIAIPSFLGQEKKSWNTDAKANVVNMWKEMRSSYYDGDSTQFTYNGAAISGDSSVVSFFTASEPSLVGKLVGGAAIASPQTLAKKSCSIATNADGNGKYTIATLVCRSKSGEFFVINDQPENAAFPTRKTFPDNASSISSGGSNW